MLKMPSFAFCLFVHLFRVLLFLVAWFMVPLGFALGKIRQGELRAGQWSGAAYTPDGTMITGVKVPTIIAEGFFSIFGLPDDPGIGLYEKTVSKIYNAKGWWWAVFYQLAFRNVAHGWLHKFAQFRLESDGPVTETITVRVGPFYYGLKRYEDWSRYDLAYVGREDFLYGDYNFPEKHAAWYFVPDFGIGKAT